MKNIFTIILIFIGLFLSGCVQPVSNSFEFEKPKENQALVYFYRPSQFYGSMIDFIIYNNNKTTENSIIGVLGNGTYFRVNLPDGENKIQFFGRNNAHIDLFAKKGNIYCLKAVDSPDEGSIIYMVDARQCASEIIYTRRTFGSGK